MFDPIPGRSSSIEEHDKNANHDKKHAGLLEISTYFIEKFKSGVDACVESDRIFVWYRTHRINATATNDPLKRPTINEHQMSDVLNVYAYVSSPASIRIITGDQQKTLIVEPGWQLFQVPFGFGEQKIELERDGKAIFEVRDMLPIVANPPKYDFDFHVAIGK